MFSDSNWINKRASFYSWVNLIKINFIRTLQNFTSLTTCQILTDLTNEYFRVFFGIFLKNFCYRPKEWDKAADWEKSDLRSMSSHGAEWDNVGLSSEISAWFGEIWISLKISPINRSIVQSRIVSVRLGGRLILGRGWDWFCGGMGLGWPGSIWEKERFDISAESEISSNEDFS